MFRVIGAAMRKLRVGDDIKINFPEAGEIAIRTALGITLKRPEDKRPFHEQHAGASLHRDTKTWRQRQQLFDRDGDWYVEVITQTRMGMRSIAVRSRYRSTS